VPVGRPQGGPEAEVERRVKAFLINLDRSADRLAQMSAEFGRIGLSFARFSGVDTLSWSQDDVARFFRERPAFSPEERLPGDAGAFSSHLRVWHEIAAEGAPAAAIFEDDVHLAADLTKLLASSNWLPADADIVRLEANSKMRLRDGRPLPMVRGRKLYRAVSGTWGAAGYVITKRAAERLIALPASTHTHIDWFLFKPTRSAVAASLRSYQVMPALCIQDHYLNGAKAGMSSIVSHGIRKVQAPPKPRLWDGLLPGRKRAVPFRP